MLTPVWKLSSYFSMYDVEEAEDCFMAVHTQLICYLQGQKHRCLFFEVNPSPDYLSVYCDTMEIYN